MAEEKGDRFGRRRYGLAHQDHNDNRASSDSEIAKAGRRPAENKKWFLHEALDVDQLARYRRRRVEGQPRDHLGLSRAVEDRDPQAAVEEEEEEEDEKRLLTEYRLAFRPNSDDIFRSNQEKILSPQKAEVNLDDDPSVKKKSEEIYVADSGSSYNVPLINLNNDSINTIEQDTLSNENQTKVDTTKTMEMESDIKRPSLIRRGTTLHQGGDFSSATEYSTYVAHPGLHRSELRRRGTSLRMEGDFDGRTEKDEQFVEYPISSCRRPDPIKSSPNLRLEGDLETSTESHEKYIPFVGAKRPEILKQSAHLKLEGNATWTAEYADVFREYDFIGRRAPKIPESNLRPDGGFYDKSETTDFYTNLRGKEVDLVTELKENAEEDEEERKKKENQEKIKLKKEEEMKLLVSKLEGLKGPPLEIPEYKDAYKNFPRERPKLLKPEDEIGRADGTKVSTTSPSPLRFKTKIDQDPEYKSMYLDTSKERSVYHRPPLGLRPSGASSRNSLFRGSLDNGDYRRDSRRFDAPTSEFHSQYVNYGHIPRIESYKMPANLRVEGEVDMEPQYQNYFTTFEGKRRERSLSASRRKDNNNWINNDNGEKFGMINAAEDQDAFQVLQTKVHEESVVGKPPIASRRNSKSSLSRASLLPVQADILSPGTRSPQPQLRNRSPSPSTTYRLQVSHADDEPRGFVRHRRSPSRSLLVQPSSDRGCSPIRKVSDRPYSPSFARENSALTRHHQQQQQQQAFVVLDNEREQKLPLRRRRTDGNCNSRNNLESVRGINGSDFRPRNKTPPNWMPPWYDSSTSTI